MHWRWFASELRRSRGSSTGFGTPSFLVALAALCALSAPAVDLGAGLSSSPPVGLCSPYTYWAADCAACTSGGDCTLSQYRCSDHELAGPPLCGVDPNFPCTSLVYSATCPLSWESLTCPKIPAEDSCVGVDDNYDGCIDGGCTKGRGACACKKTCAHADAPDCEAPEVADCTPAAPQDTEPCAGGTDETCDGNPGGSCAPGVAPGGGGWGLAWEGVDGQPSCTTGGGPSSAKCAVQAGTCAEKVGSDPILIASRSVATEPFTDFRVKFISELSLSRTYNSNDVSIVKGTESGPFGLGWHHDWEGSLRCDGAFAPTCTVVRGLLVGLQFQWKATARSLDGRETWDIYTSVGDHHDLLARRPNGTWILYFAAGGTLEFQTVCDACSFTDQLSPTCTDPRNGGIARLVKVIDPVGNAVTVSYDRPNGLLLGLRDDLNHKLELRSTEACTTGLAPELQFDEMTPHRRPRRSSPPTTTTSSACSRSRIRAARPRPS